MKSALWSHCGLQDVVQSVQKGALFLLLMIIVIFVILFIQGKAVPWEKDPGRIRHPSRAGNNIFLLGLGSISQLCEIDRVHKVVGSKV